MKPNQPNFPGAGWGRCEQGCNDAATQLVVTMNGYLVDVCDMHARELCDPIGPRP